MIQLKFLQNVSSFKIKSDLKIALVITNSISEMIQKLNGAALVIDYGENQALSNSIRVIFSKITYDNSKIGNQKS